MFKKPTYEELEKRVKQLEKAEYARKEAEEVLHKSEEKYRGIFDESIAAVYVFDEKKYFIDSNQAGLDLLGYSRDELLSLSIPDVDADPVVVLPAHKQLLSGENIVNYEHQLRRKDGMIITVLNNSRPLTNTEGDVIGLQSTLIDISERKQAEEELNNYRNHLEELVAERTSNLRKINEELKREITERKQAEEALRESEKKYQDLYDNAPDMFCSVDATTGTILQCNQTLANNLRYTKEEIVGRPVFDLYAPNSVEYAKSTVFPLFVKTGSIKGEELQLQRKDGSTVDVSLNVSAVSDEKGNILRSRSVWRDITKRKQVEKERERLIRDLKEALKEIKTLRGILPLCSFCKKIRDDRGYWEQVDVYIHKHSQADISHSVCPECAKVHYPDLDIYDD